MKEKKMNEKKNKSILPGVIVAALLVSVIVYAVLLNAETNALKNYEKKSIYVATKQIPKGQTINEDNYQSYIHLQEVDAKLIPDTAISAPEQLQDLIASYSIDAGTLLTSGMFQSVNEVTKNMKEPVIAGFKADDMYQVVGGVLRAGDRIHIYSVDEESGETNLKWSSIFVQEVFDQTGTVITTAEEDEKTPAQRINVYMDKSDIEEFYSDLAKGSLRAVKVSE